jgi:hypothetical protein
MRNLLPEKEKGLQLFIKQLNKMLMWNPDIYPDIGCPDIFNSKLVDMFDNLAITTTSNNETGHLSGHSCPDNTKSNGINGQSGQSKLGDSDSVRYNEAAGDDIKQDIGHFIGHVR